jgi:lysyl oxidase
MRLRAAALGLAACALVAGPARAGDPLLPDLSVFAGNIELELDTNVDLGDVAELCARAAIGVDLLLFDATTANDPSAGDLAVGDPMCPNDCDANPGVTCGNPDFHCSPAGGHGHPHFTNYARYELFEPGGLVPVRTGGKFGFCLEDTSCTPPATPFFDCGFQGLTAGCEDLYSRFLGCQYIDVTGLVSGDYVLRVTADPEDKIPELDETNNFTEYDVAISGTEELEESIPGTSLAVKVVRQGTRVKLLSKAGATDFVLPSPPVAPTLEGATLSVVDGGAGSGGQVFALPAAGWKGLGSPPGSKGYRYRGGKDDDCRSAKLTASRLSASCTGEAVVLPVVGGVNVELISGASKRYCTSFGGEEKRNDAAKLKRVKAPPAPCPFL